MGKYKFTFTNILFWVGIVVSLIVFENITFFDKPTINGFMNLGMPDPYFFMLFALAAFCYLSMIIYESVMNHAKVNVISLVCCLTLLGTGIAGIMLFDGMEFTNGAEAIVVDQWSKIKHILSFVLFILSIYSITFYFSKNHPSIKRLRFLFIAVIIVTYFFVIYSIVTEYSKYELIANAKETEIIRNVGIKSLFLNSNMFAGFILMGICASIGLNYFKKNIFSFISIIGFTTIQVFACSLTAIIITLVLVFSYFLLEIILVFKKSLGKGMLKLFVMLAITIGIVILFAMCQTYQIEGLSTFFRFLYQEMSNTDYGTFSSRVNIWNNALAASNQNIFTLLFGYGFRNSEYIVGGMVNVEGHKLSCHNGYLQILLNFGVVGLAVFALFIGVYFYSLIRLMKYHKRFALIFLLLGASYFAMAVTESLIAFNASAQGILIGTLFYLPVINRFTHLKHQEIGDYAIHCHNSPRLIEPKLMVRSASRVILGLMALVSTFFIFDECRESYIIYYTLINAEIVLSIAFLLLPYLVGLWSKHGSIMRFIVHLTIFALIIDGASLATSLIYMFIPGLDNNFKWFIPLGVIGALVLFTIIYSFIFRGGLSLYLNTFVGFKTSIGSLIGMGLFYAGLYFAKGYMIPNSLITYLVTGITAVMVFVVFSLIVPTKDTVKIIYNDGEFDANLMRIDVIRDRLEEPYGV